MDRIEPKQFFDALEELMGGLCFQVRLSKTGPCWGCPKIKAPVLTIRTHFCPLIFEAGSGEDHDEEAAYSVDGAPKLCTE